jgi:hypothetical protein
MKKIFLFLICIYSFSSVFAQDNIILKNGDEIKAKVLEVTITDVKYKKYENQEGPIYTISKSDILMIKYENGQKDVFADSKKTSDTLANVTSHKADDKRKMFIFSLDLYGGDGFARLKTLYINKEFIYIRPGGGGGIGGTFGCNITNDFNISLSALAEKNTTFKYAKTESSDFNRFIVRSSFKYKVSVPQNSYFNFGGGLGVYTSVTLPSNYKDMNKTDALYYKTAFGPHLQIDYQLLFAKKSWSVNFSTICYFVTYKLDSYTDINGSIVQPSNVYSIYRKINGSGIDLCFSLAKHF